MSSKAEAKMWKNNLVLVLYSFIWLSSIAQCSKDCLLISDRPSSLGIIPARRGVLPGTDNVVNLNRHHIIPFQVLRNFFNVAVSVSDNDELSDAVDFQIRGAVNEYVLPNSYSSEVVQALRTPIPTVLPRGEMLQRILQAFFIWLPGNIFYGPPQKLRSDDPGSSFEKTCQPIIGERAYGILSHLYTQMVNFVNDENVQTVEVFNSIIYGIQLLAGRTNQFEYNQDQWEEDPTNERNQTKYRIRPRRDRRFNNIYPVLKATPTEDNEQCFVPKLNNMVFKAFLDVFVILF